MGKTPVAHSDWLNMRNHVSCLQTVAYRVCFVYRLSAARSLVEASRWCIRQGTQDASAQQSSYNKQLYGSQCSITPDICNSIAVKAQATAQTDIHAQRHCTLLRCGCHLQVLFDDVAKGAVLWMLKT